MGRTRHEKLSLWADLKYFRRGQWFYKRPKMTAFFIILIAVLLILLGSSIRTFASSRLDSQNGAMQKYYTSIRIEPGDTLWKIADSYITPEMSKKEFIREVCQLNHMGKDDILRSGDYIVVVYYTDYSADSVLSRH